jgi:hypothetical protein
MHAIVKETLNVNQAHASLIGVLIIAFLHMQLEVMYMTVTVR